VASVGSWSGLRGVLGGLREVAGGLSVVMGDLREVVGCLMGSWVASKGHGVASILLLSGLRGL
jgi:hypothetical protein